MAAYVKYKWVREDRDQLGPERDRTSLKVPPLCLHPMLAAENQNVCRVVLTAPTVLGQGTPVPDYSSTQTPCAAGSPPPWATHGLKGFQSTKLAPSLQETRTSQHLSVVWALAPTLPSRASSQPLLHALGFVNSLNVSSWRVISHDYRPGSAVRPQLPGSEALSGQVVAHAHTRA